MKSKVFNGLISIAGIFVLLFAVGCGAGMMNKGPVNFSGIEQNFASKSGIRESVAFQHGEDGHFAVAVNGSSVTLYDAKSAEFLKKIDTQGSEKGQIDNPCDVVVYDNLAFVLENGNKRIQVFELPAMESLGFIGETLLNDPSDLAIYRIEHGAYYLYVADSTEYKGRTTNYIRKIHASRAVNTMHFMYTMTFGYSKSAGYLGKINVISVEQDMKQVLVGAEGTSQPVAFSLEGESI